MKRKIIIGFATFSLILFVGALYIVTVIDKTTSKADRLIMLHQVEILREHLLIQIYKVQADLSLMRTAREKNPGTIGADIRNLTMAADICLDCHHAEGVRKKLVGMRDHVSAYKEEVGKVLTVREGGVGRFEAEERKAFLLGENLIGELNGLISIATAKLEAETRQAIGHIANTRFLLVVLVTAGTTVAGVLSFLFIQGFTKPLDIILSAIRRLKGGELDHRIEGLTHEFGEVAASFNEMADALKKQMQEIEASEKRYRMLFESAGDGIFILEGEGVNAGQIVTANSAAAIMHGYTVDELVKLNIRDLDTPDAAKDIGSRIQRILKGEKIEVEITHVRKDGSIFPVEINASLLDLGTRKFIMAIDRDISERKRNEEALMRTEQMRVVGELAAGLAHEIKNPLAGIKVSMEMLSEESTLSEEDRDVLLKVVGEIRHIELLIKGLLNFARPPKPQFAPVELNKLLDTALTFALKRTSSSADSQIRVVEEFSDSLPATLTDAMQLKQVFLNLLLNAIDAMPEGGTLSVKSSYNRKGDSLKVEISDTGKGMTEGEMDKIFQPFFTTKAKGTGLGLAITKRLIEGQGGSIIVQSAPGRGTTFCICLPVRKLEGQAA